MNERIRELAEQATEKFNTYFDGRGNVTETYFDKEKFAQLIVRECITKIKITEVPQGNIPALGMVVRTLKEHFGVEE